MPTPEESLASAEYHQGLYEELALEMFPSANDRMKKMHHAIMAENRGLLAIAGFMAQQNICDHGVRGWCPDCHKLLKSQTDPYPPPYGGH